VRKKGTGPPVRLDVGPAEGRRQLSAVGLRVTVVGCGGFRTDNVILLMVLLMVLSKKSFYRWP